MIAQDGFVAATPAQVAPRLAGAIHVWRVPYQRSERRAPLIAILADYVDADPAELALMNDAHGKPHLLLQGTEHRDLHFNWSHSGDYALIALAQDAMPGIDIEQQREQVRVIEIAQRFFTPDEARELTACTADEREVMFFRLWCAKEAVLKAMGRGLAFGLERVAFQRRGALWQPGIFDPQAGDPDTWQVLSITAAAGYAGALAWQGTPRQVQAWRLSGS